MTSSSIYGVFERVSSVYDRMNTCMSLGMHRLWKRHFVRQLHIPQDGNVLDVATGTGDIVRGILNHFSYRDLHITGLDPIPSMLKLAHQKTIDMGFVKNVSWVEGAAEYLPFEDATFDVYTIVFGLRNVSDRRQALDEAHRVLKPGGQIAIMELSSNLKGLLQQGFSFYTRYVVPKLGAWIANDQASYDYLVSSMIEFPGSDEVCAWLHRFKDVRVEILTSGPVAVYHGFKA